MIPAVGRYRSSGVWTPAALYTGANGLWVEASDLATLFQDSAMTTAVSANGNPVGAWKDKSGNGNHVTQATSTARPTYASGTYPAISFDGSSQFLQVAAQIIRPEDAHEIWVALQTPAEVSGWLNFITFASVTGATYGAMVAVYADQGKLKTLNQTLQPTTKNSTAISFAFYSPSTNAVLGGVCSGNVAGSLNETLYVNNGAGSVGPSVAVQTGYNNATGETSVGSYAAAPNRLWHGPIYAIVAINRALTTGERASLKTYLAAKYGGVL